MRLAEIQFEHGFKPTPTELEQIKQAWVYGQDPSRNDGDGDFYWWAMYLVDLNQMPPVKYTIQRHIVDKNNTMESLDVNTAGRVPAFNDRLNITVPGLGLLLLNEVILQPDCCTYRLNELMQEGWRIVAVCPQPDQRRPDYILGRSKHD